MDSAQRVACAMNHRPVDRTPKFDYVLQDPCASLVLGRRFLSYDESESEWKSLAGELGGKAALERYVRERLEIAEKLGQDLLYVVPPPSLDQEPQEPKGSYEDPVDRVAARNERSLKGLERPLSAFGLSVYEELNRLMERPVALFAPAYTLGVWSDVDLMQTMLLDPDVAREHFSICARQAELQAKAYAERGVRLIGIGGDFAGNRPIISPELYREFVVPEVRRVADTVHSLGAWAVNASDGNLWDVADDFLLGCGVDGYMEIDSRAGMDLRRLKERYGDRICLMGNLDCGELMSYGTPESIRREVLQCLEDGGSTGHIFTPSNAITETVPFENFRAMHDAYSEYFGLDQVAW